MIYNLNSFIVKYKCLNNIIVTCFTLCQICPHLPKLQPFSQICKFDGYFHSHFTFFIRRGICQTQTVVGCHLSETDRVRISFVRHRQGKAVICQTQTG